MDVPARPLDRPAEARAPGVPALDTAEAALLKDARDGNLFAFEEIVKRYQRRVYATALRIVRRHDVADDVVQEAFLRAHQALGRFDLARPFGPWICRIAANLAVNHVRSPESREEALPEAHAETPVPGGEPARRACSTTRRGGCWHGRLEAPARRAARRLRPARVRRALLQGDRGGARDLDRDGDEPALARRASGCAKRSAPYLGPAMARRAEGAER